MIGPTLYKLFDIMRFGNRTAGGSGMRHVETALKEECKFYREAAFQA